MAWIWVGSPRWCACRVLQRVRPRRAASSRLGDEGQLRNCEGLTPTTRVAHPDPGHRSPTARVLLASTAPYRSGPPSGSGKAQLSPDYGSGGWGFESLAARHRNCSSAALSGGRCCCQMGRSATRLPPRWRAAPTRLRPPATTIASSHRPGHFRVGAPLPRAIRGYGVATQVGEARRDRESARHRSVVLDRRGAVGWRSLPRRRGDLVQPVVPLTTSALPRATPPHPPATRLPCIADAAV
jgi:hypothetical protein